MTNQEIKAAAVATAIRIAKDDSHGYSQINRQGPDCRRNCNILPLKELCRAEIVGVDANTRFVYLDNGAGITCTSGDYLKPAEGGKDGIATFATLFIGANAYGTTDIAGGGIEHIVKQKGYGNDPLNQRSSVGWKATKVATRLVEEYMLRVESGSSFSSSVVEAN